MGSPLSERTEKIFWQRCNGNLHFRQDIRAKPSFYSHPFTLKRWQVYLAKRESLFDKAQMETRKLGQKCGQILGWNVGNQRQSWKLKIRHLEKPLPIWYTSTDRWNASFCCSFFSFLRKHQYGNQCRGNTYQL
jgi:hypothetical protein